MRSINSFGFKCESNKCVSKDNFPFVSIAFLVFLTLVAFIVPLFIKEPQNYMNLSRTYISPNSKYIFGTDGMGRNILIRCIYGGRVSILVGVACMIISSAIGIIYGCVSGYYGKILDKIMMRILDFFLILPSIVIVAFIQAFFENKGLLEIILVISITSWMRVARIVRGEVLKLKSSEFVVASRGMGAGFFHILRRHLLPNFMPTIIFICTLNVASAIVTESTLSFLGLGLPVEIPSWGSMLIDAQKDILSNKWWTSLFPGIMIIATVLSVNSIGEYIRKLNHKNFVSL
ncbi:ABC transporter permease [Haloimpatiens lingqiaonensis]|uniref:ABC transporter permease n=1 Tax=Haloimpatiens lingqiaonensis TaxID=1380675 RepID=UPI0010FEF369|nr:ABC transporter permease [Haloimpatiens lingqiaonensis]